MKKREDRMELEGTIVVGEDVRWECKDVWIMGGGQGLRRIHVHT